MNVLASALGKAYPGLKIPFWQMGVLTKLQKECEEWNIDGEDLVASMPRDVAQPFFYFRKVVQNKVEDVRHRRVAAVVRRREKNKQSYYNEEEY